MRRKRFLRLWFGAWRYFRTSTGQRTRPMIQRSPSNLDLFKNGPRGNTRLPGWSLNFEPQASASRAMCSAIAHSLQSWSRGERHGHVTHIGTDADAITVRGQHGTRSPTGGSAMKSGGVTLVFPGWSSTSPSHRHDWIIGDTRRGTTGSSPQDYPHDSHPVRAQAGKIYSTSGGKCRHLCSESILGRPPLQWPPAFVKGARPRTASDVSPVYRWALWVCPSSQTVSTGWLGPYQHEPRAGAPASLLRV